MKKQINYPKIGQFRNIVSGIKLQSQYVGHDINDLPLYDNTLPYPKIKFTGTVKLHGTNAAVCFNEKEGMWFQSRNRIITPELDNAGFAWFANSNDDSFIDMFAYILSENNLYANECTISIYGEWAGKGIQKGVAISELERGFYIFAVKVSPFDENEDSYWVDISKMGLADIKNNIFDIYSFPTYEIEIDFSQPELAQNKLIDITNKVEEMCPVAKARKIEGIGEGVVWTGEYKGSLHRFKVKGEKHSTSKVKKLANVDMESIENIKDFVEYAVTYNRFSQSLQEVFGIGVKPDIKKLGDVIRWVVGDILSEESDVMKKNNLTPKQIGKYIAHKVRKMFFELI